MTTARKYFGTDGIRGVVGGDKINPELALRLGYAAGKVLAEKKHATARPTVVIGKDTRISGYMLESALEAGLSAAGVDVLLAGPVPTPAVAYLTRTLRLSAGIVISASHNPYYDNGIKFFSAQGMKLPDDTEERIEALLEQPIQTVSSDGLGRASRIIDAAGRYIEFCKSTFPNDLNLSGYKIVVDAANGAAYHIAPHVFRELGAEIVEVGCKPDGFNINAKVGALYPGQLVSTVQEHSADFGIALDGDADRLVMADRHGRIYNGDELLYMIVRDRMLSQKVNGVVGTLMTNLGLELRLQALGVDFIRAKVGDRYVLEQLQVRDWLYGGESSGHLLCLDHHTTGDGIIAALQILTALRHQDCSLAELVADLEMYPQHMENLDWPQGLDWTTQTALVEAKQAVENMLGETGRVLIRPSGTEPKLRIMVEAKDTALIKEAMATLLDAVNKM
ncbi:MAG TPA: phosphoglucosamine mutase [Paenalcaligenes sp.]|nr:phosphoglucosamine mutase [Paenalcaligenes sp.]